jgi:hypothetical protein
MENYFNGHSVSIMVLGKCRQNTYEYGNGIAEQEGYLNINSKVSDYINRMD